MYVRCYSCSYIHHTFADSKQHHKFVGTNSQTATDSWLSDLAARSPHFGINLQAADTYVARPAPVTSSLCMLNSPKPTKHHQSCGVACAVAAFGTSRQRALLQKTFQALNKHSVGNICNDPMHDCNTTSGQRGNKTLNFKSAHLG